MKILTMVSIALILTLAAGAQTNSYTVTPIVNNTQDPYLVNPWGMSRPASSGKTENEWWVSDNVTGYTTLYYANQTGSQSLAPLVIAIPSASGIGRGTPTGTAYNPAVGPGPGPQNFTFVSQDGTISNWNTGQKPSQAGRGCYQCHVNSTTVMVNNSGSGASYTGLALATNATSKQATYYAANHSSGAVEAYNATTFDPVQLSGTFTDSKLPAGYRPYGVQAIGTDIVVTFYNDISGGYVDAFDTNGNLKVRLPQGSFSQPWGVTIAPSNFGVFSNTLLVANATSGWIAAFSMKTGGFEGFLEDPSGDLITIPGIWGIEFGDGNAESGPTTTLYYSAGGSAYATGVFGAITAN